MNDSPAPGDTFESKPLPSMVSANVTWISPQARTHRVHARHLDGSKSKYGLLVSLKASRVSVAQSFGMSTPASAAARMTDVPSGTATRSPSTSTETVAGPSLAGVP